MMAFRIERKLVCEKSDSEKKVFTASEISNLPGPVLILGDPGSGKTVLTKALGELPGLKYIRAGTFVRQASSNLFTTGDECVVVDGIDEIRSLRFGSAVDEVLTKLSEVGNPRFILSCRAADWQGSAGKVKIKDDYNVEPWLLYMLPFTYEDAHAFLTHEFQDIDAANILDRLRDKGIENIYGNPLTLRLVGEVVKKDGSFPNSRAELLEQACHIMLEEKNERHHNRPHALNSEDVLKATGAICATVVLCDRIGIYTGAYGTTPAGFARSEDIAKLPFGGLQEHALKTRLFRTEGESCFVPIHRVIAEYLGAKWLVNCFNDGASEKRIIGLLRHGEGVPTSLRGLHAWMVHFSDELAKSCIAADPIAVLKNGVAEHLRLSQARFFLSTLKESLAKDPRLVLGANWPQFLHRASGLMHTELQDDIRAIIEKPGQNLHLTVILLQSMVRRDLAMEFASLLREIMFSRDRTYAERFSAAKAINAAAIQDSWDAVLRDLLEMTDPDSARLAYEILVLVGTCNISNETATEAVLSQSGLDGRYDPLSESYHPIPDSRLFGDRDAGRLPCLLDTLASRARPLIEQINSSGHLPIEGETQTEYQQHPDQYLRIHDAKCFTADLVRRLTVKVLEADLEVPHERVWEWIGWLEESDGYDRDSKARLAKLVCENHALRTALIEQVLLTPSAENTWEVAWGAGRVLACLRPTSKDVAMLLRAWRARANDDPLDPGVWRSLLGIGFQDAVPNNTLHDTALEVANGVPELLAILAEESESAENAMAFRAEAETRQQERRQQAFQSLRDDLGVCQDYLDRGDIVALAEPAAIYLDRSTYRISTANIFKPSADKLSPDERLSAILGDALSERAMLGFMAVLDRDDLPKASEIVQLYCQNRRYQAEPSMICGLAEMLRRSIPINAVDRAVLAAVYTALQRAPESNRELQIDIGSALEEILFSTESDWETHFRMSIEPQLAHNKDIIFELRRLCNDPGLTRLAGRLVIEWLRMYPELSLDTHRQLIDCMLRNTDRTAVHTLVERRLASVDQTSNEWLLWLSVAFVTDFDNRREALENAAAEYPGFLWFIRDRIQLQPDSPSAENGGQRLAAFSLDQLAFIVQSFAEHWPIVVTRPSSWSGDRNKWDANDFITSVVRAIARISSHEATEVLRSLLAANLQSYADTINRALTAQLRNRRDAENRAPTVDQLRAVVTSKPPETIDDMRTWFADRIETLQEKMHGSNTDMWQAYWANSQPQDENYCRNRLIEHISRNLPESIRIEPEPHMPMDKRGDIALMRNQIKLPIEIKGQWHSAVWTAASDQLAKKYACDWQAKGCGAYIVLWFGNVHGKQLPGHPDGPQLPQTPEALREMLIQSLPDELHSRIDVYVIDVSKPS